MSRLDHLTQQALRDITANPRPADLTEALVRVRQNPTEYLRAFQHGDNAELGRLVAHEIKNALMARAQAEARELLDSMERMGAQA